MFERKKNKALKKKKTDKNFIDIKIYPKIIISKNISESTIKM